VKLQVVQSSSEIITTNKQTTAATLQYYTVLPGLQAGFPSCHPTSSVKDGFY